MTPAEDVGPLEAFPDRRVRCVTVAGRTVGVVRLGGEVFALRDRCPHEGASLCAGAVEELLGADGEQHLTVSDDRLVLACPWHGWEFDVRTGRTIVDPKIRAKTYRAWVDDARVFVEVGAGADG